MKKKSCGPFGGKQKNETGGFSSKSDRFDVGRLDAQSSGLVMCALTYEAPRHEVWGATIWGAGRKSRAKGEGIFRWKGLGVDAVLDFFCFAGRSFLVFWFWRDLFREFAVSRDLFRASALSRGFKGNRNLHCSLLVFWGNRCHWNYVFFPRGETAKNNLSLERCCHSHLPKSASTFGPSGFPFLQPKFSHGVITSNFQVLVSIIIVALWVFLNCYWVGSLDFSVLGNQRVFQ